MAEMQHRKKGFPEGSVCKPCWELKYCPYGDLVEYFPFASDEKIDMADIRQRYLDALSQLTSGEINSEDELWDAIQILLYNSPAGWEDVQEFDPRDVNCLIYGHVCPVFLKQSG